MSNPLRTTLRRKVAALLAAPLLLGTVTAAATPRESTVAVADQVTYKETFYSDSTYSTVVGYGYWYCDGDFIMVSGYQTAYSTLKFIAACP